MHPKPARLAAIGLSAVIALPLFTAPLLAQGQNQRTLAQMENRYPQMSPVHIEKCDRDGNGIYDNGEQACVSSMWGVLRDNR